VPPRIVLLDTSFVLALENGEDSHHARAKQLDRELAAQGAVLLLHWGFCWKLAMATRGAVAAPREWNFSTSSPTKKGFKLRPCPKR